MVHRTVHTKQADILNSIAELHLGGDWYEADLTYGKGCFWKESGTDPKYCYDIEPKFEHVETVDSTNLPFLSDNHKLHPTHINMTQWAAQVRLRLKDLFILAAKHRMPLKAAPHGKQTQRHARIHHSYFLVFERMK